MRPSASWPTALRAVRASSWSGVNCSFARKTGRPLHEHRPAAERVHDVGHAGLQDQRIFTVCPVGPPSA
jgi:hypothetical protein